MKTRITIQGRNRKVGFGVPVSTTESDSCPDSCEFKNGVCYAKKGRTRLIWDEVKTGFSRRAKKPFSNSWDHFIEEIKYLRPKQLWRHNQAGDLPNKGNDNESIDPVKLAELVKANKKKYGFTYTHKTKPTHLKENLKLIKWSNKNGFTINLSANNPEHADELAKHGLPVAVVVGDKPIKKTPQGRPVAMCPYQKTKDSVDIITCDRCRLCQNSKRRSIVGFLTE